MSKLTAFIKRHPVLLCSARFTYRWLQPLYRQPVTGWAGYLRLFADWRKYLAAGGQARLIDFYPCLADRTQTTPIDPQYFYQAVWAAGKIRSNAARLHVDVGSEVNFVGMLSTMVPVEFVDIRPLPVEVENLSCRKGSIVALPYADASVASVSSMHVLEHIGLGRYGDPIDPEGTHKGCRELARILAPVGSLYVSIPIGIPRVKFNGLRVFSVQEIFNYFRGLELADMAFVDNFGRFYSRVDPGNITFDEQAGADFALGCFHFVKR